ncbi:MAG: lysoplasmalogenase [Aureibaculum sp.]|nr:lysoplasmalogenase [Aureibaculum sp.]
MTKNLTILFFVVAISDVIGIIFNIAWLQIVSKPLIILTLFVLYYFSAEKRNNWYLLALFFSFLGDVFLLDKTGYFLLGIGSFLITQILFIKVIISQLRKVRVHHIIITLLPFVVYFTVLISTIKENLTGFFIPVVIYGITISFFGMVSLLNYFINKSKKSVVLLIGAVLFIASDSMIALNKFHEPRIIYPVAIMITYIFAQYLIYRFMRNLNK